MTEIPDSVMEEARKAAANIMDNACLGEHWVKNGVDAALRKDIKDAILAAEKRGEERERERCAKIAEQKFNIDTVGKNAKGKPYQTGSVAINAAGRIAAAIRKGSD